MMAETRNYKQFACIEVPIALGRRKKDGNFQAGNSTILSKWRKTAEYNAYKLNHEGFKMNPNID